MTIKDLELVRYVAASGSLTVAARQLHISQSAVSQRLTALHSRLELKLIERRDGLMQLTAAGHRVFEASKVIADELQSTMLDIKKLKQHQEEQLRISTQCYTCYRWLPFVISAMREAHPLLNVDVVPEATDAPYEALRSNQIDVALVSNPVDKSGFSEHELFADELFAVMHADHELASEEFISAAKFSGQTLILYTGDSHPIVDDVLAPAKIDGYTIIQVRITEAIIELARSGRGIAVIAGWALDDIDETDNLVAVRILREGFRRSWRAAFRDDLNEEYVKSFVHVVREVGTTIGTKAWRSKLRVASC